MKIAKMIRLRPIVSLIAAAVLSLGCGAVVGYAIAQSANDLDTEYSSLPTHYKTARYSTSPSALESADTEQEPGLESQDPPSMEGWIRDGDGDGRPRYLLGTDHGFVAVFYVNDNQGQNQILKERTRTPESVLSPIERERLQRGIYLYNEEQLVKALQDYGS